MLPTLLPALTCLGARRFCSKRRPFGSLPVKMKFLGSRTLPNCPKQLQMSSYSLWMCNRCVFQSILSFEKKNNLGILLLLLILLQGLSDSQAQLFSFLTKPICASPPKPAYMPAFGLKIDRPASRHLQPALRIGSTCKGMHVALFSLIDNPFL